LYELLYNKIKVKEFGLNAETYFVCANDVTDDNDPDDVTGQRPRDRKYTVIGVGQVYGRDALVLRGSADIHGGYRRKCVDPGYYGTAPDARQFDMRLSAMYGGRRSARFADRNDTGVAGGKPHLHRQGNGVLTRSSKHRANVEQTSST